MAIPFVSQIYENNKKVIPHVAERFRQQKKNFKI